MVEVPTTYYRRLASMVGISKHVRAFARAALLISYAPVATAFVEGAISKIGRTLSSERSSMSNETLNDEMVLRGNAKLYAATRAQCYHGAGSTEARKSLEAMFGSFMPLKDSAAETSHDAATLSASQGKLVVALPSSGAKATMDTPSSCDECEDRTAAFTRIGAKRARPSPVRDLTSYFTSAQPDHDEASKTQASAGMPAALMPSSADSVGTSSEESSDDSDEEEGIGSRKRRAKKQFRLPSGLRITPTATDGNCFFDAARIVLGKFNPEKFGNATA